MSKRMREAKTLDYLRQLRGLRREAEIRDGTLLQNRAHKVPDKKKLQNKLACRGRQYGDD